MMKMAKITICAIAVVAIGMPTIAVSASDNWCSPSGVAGSVYRGGASLAERTEGLCTGILKTTFGFFNPCLDLVKGCTNVVLAPIERPFAAIEWVTGSKPKQAKKASKVPVPKKPEMPAK